MPVAWRILVVEDHVFQRVMLSQILKALGAGVVHQATNGIEAKRALQTRGKNFDLIVTDLMMPNLDGIELLSVVQDLAPRLPIILCSIDESSLMAAHAIARGKGLRVLGTVTKPLEVAKLSPLLAKLDGLAGE